MISFMIPAAFIILHPIEGARISNLLIRRLDQEDFSLSSVLSLGETWGELKSQIGMCTG